MGNPYTRQSAAQIVTGNVVEAAPINAEFNTLQNAFDGSSGHAHDGAIGNGPKISLTNSIVGVLPIVNGGTGGINKLNATTAPTVGDDSADGYAVGSIWIDTTGDFLYVCVDSTPGAAIWKTFQEYDNGLQSISNLTTSADKTIYTTASDTYATTTLTAYGRSLIDDVDASTALTTLGVSPYAKTLLDDADASTAMSTLGFSAYHKTLVDDPDASTTLSTLGFSAFGKTIIDDPDAPAVRTTIGLGNVDNTSDLNKPVSTATQTALNLKAPLASPNFTGVPTAPTAAVTDNSTQLATTSFVQSMRDLSANNKNRIINGNFDVWQRATSQTTSNYGSDDRWANLHAGSTKTVSRVRFNLGATEVPGNPTNFSRTVVSSTAGAGNFVNKLQNIEDVRTFSGKTVTVTFYAKADVNRNIAFDMYQYFGTGGSPSATVGFGRRLIPLTSSWQRISSTVPVPSISGKVVGLTSHALGIRFWFDAGTSWATESSSLGQQSGTFDLARVSIVEGDATQEADPSGNVIIGLEELLCQRYFQWANHDVIFYNSVAANTQFSHSVSFPTTMRATPSVGTVSANPNGSGTTLVNVVAQSVGSVYPDSILLSTVANTSGYAYMQGYRWPLDAEIL